MENREHLYELLKTVLDDELFSFDDDMCLIKPRAPIRAEDVKNLSDFVKSMLKNSAKPSPNEPFDRKVGNGSFKIFGDFVDHDDTLKVDSTGRLGVATDAESIGDAIVNEYVKSVFEKDGRLHAKIVKDGKVSVKELDLRPPVTDEDLKKIRESNERMLKEIAEIRHNVQNTQRQLADLGKYIEKELAGCVRV